MAIKKKPKVSLIMPVYNAENWLKESIRSIIRQTYKNWELIIIDDASYDNSWNIIKTFKNHYPQKIRAIKLKENLNKGGDACANLGFQKSKGEFIARMDSDDIAYPQRLEKQVNFLLNNPDIFMVGSQAWVIDKNNKIIGEKKVPLSHKDIYKNYFIFHPMIHPSIMLRKNQVKRKNLYKIKYSANNDLLTFFEFLKNKKFANLPNKLIYYRIHGKNDSLSNIKNKYFNTLKIRIKAIKRAKYKPSFKSIIINFIQFFTIILFPEKVVLLLYLLAKKIITPKQIINNFKSKICSFLFFNLFKLRLSNEKKVFKTS